MADPYAQAKYLEPGAAIQQLNFLAGVNSAEVRELFVNAVQEITLYASQLLFEQDKPIERVWLLLEGKVRQHRREVDAGKPRQLLLRECGPGTLIGVYDFLFETTYRTRASALTQCRLLAIEAKALSRLIYRFPDMRSKLAPLEVIGRLRTYPLLGKVEPVGLGFLADVLSSKDYHKGDVLYRSGERVDHIFLLNRGQVELRWTDGSGNGGGERRQWIGNGALLGLTRGRVANNAVTVQHDCTVNLPAKIFSAPREVFITITGLAPDKLGLDAIDEVETHIVSMPVFGGFTPEQKQRLAGFFSHNYYPSNHLLVQQHEAADSLWVLLPNSSAIIRALDSSGRSMLDTVITGPTYFAETALLGQILQDSTVEAEAGSEWLRLHWHDFEYFDEMEQEDMRAALRIKTAKQPMLVGKEARSKYPWLQPGESVAYFGRQHWVAFVSKNLPTFIFLVVLVVIAGIGFAIPGAQVWVGWLVGLFGFLALATLIWAYIDYRNDWLVVTNRRLVYQNKVVFVRVWRKEAPLESIQSLDLMRNFVGRYLGYGTLIARTAGSAGEIRFNYTTDFDKLRSTIKTQQEQRQRHAAAQSKLNIHRKLEQRLGLMVEPPSRVVQDEPRAREPDSWRSMLSGRQGIGIRWQEGNRIVWRKHWMALIPMVGPAGLTPLLFILLAIGGWVLSNRWLPGEWEGLAVAFQWMMAILSLVFLARLMWVIIDWYNDTYEVSDTEVVNVSKAPFALDEDRRSARLDRIQNVDTTIPSPVHLLLDYGTVIIQTAAEGGTLQFYSVPGPRTVAAEILARIEQARRREYDEEVRRRNDDLPNWFEMYNRLENGRGERVRG